MTDAGYIETTLARPTADEDELGHLIEETRDILDGWGGRHGPEKDAGLFTLLPERRGESWKFRVLYGWEPGEVAQIVAWVKGVARGLREDAAALQANPIVVGDTDLLRQAGKVEECAARWLP